MDGTRTHNQDCHYEHLNHSFYVHYVQNRILDQLCGYFTLLSPLLKLYSVKRLSKLIRVPVSSFMFVDHTVE